MIRCDANRTVSIDEIEGEYDLHHEYRMIQVQLLQQGLDDCGHDEGETVENGILVHPIQKFGRMFVLRCQGSKEYRHVKVDAGLGEMVNEIDLVEPILKRKD